MRKLYALLTGFALALTGLQARAQNETANFTFISSGNNVHFTNTSNTSVNDTAHRRCLWEFGDGTSLLTYYSVNPYHTYAQTTAVLEACLKLYRRVTPTTPNGDTLVLVSSICKPVTLSQPDSCTAGFESQSSTATALGKYFIAHPWNNHNKKPVQVCWNFGDNHDTCIQYATSYTGAYAVYHLYAQRGAYNVCVNILYDGGCQSQNCHSVQVGEADSCSADFQRLPVSPTSNPLQATFQALPWNNHNSRPVKICWSFGDNHDTCIQYTNANPGPFTVNHTYGAPGSYQVCVDILYDGGCDAHKCNSVVINADSCRADFERIVSSTANPLQAYFQALPWHSNNKKPGRICWTFGDGRDTCITYPSSYTGQYVVTHHYSQPGLYEVCVDILYDGGCESRKCKPTQVGEPDSCSANFTTIASSSTTLGKYFIAQPWHNHNKKPVRVCWNFGDNHDTCIQYATSYTGTYAVYHLYQHTGAYNVCVNILYDGGCESHNCHMVQVGEPDSCAADFERLPNTSTNPFIASFHALPFNNHQRKPARICWTFGDGRDTCITYAETYSGTYGVAHAYGQPGSYQVCVHILYYGGCEATSCKTIVIENPNQTCAVHLFEITPSITSLLREFFASPASSPNRRPINICWYFGDGHDTCYMISTANSVSNFFTNHTYPGPGVYHACVKITFDGGCIANDCIDVTIRGNSNVCGGYMVDSLIGTRELKFRGFSIHDPNDPPISFNWTFGDGTTASGQEVIHTYNQAGEYRVCLNIHTQLGCETNICRTIHVPGTNNQPTLVLSPNPVINTLHALFFSSNTEQVNIKIFTATGTPVRSYVRNATVGANNWDFDLSTLTSGIYSFVIQSPNQLASAIFVKQ